MNPGGKKSGGDTEFSVSDAIDEETKKLLEVVDQEILENVSKCP